MVDRELIHWTIQNLSRGYSPKQLSDQLIGQGYDPEDVTDAINFALQLNPIPPPNINKNAQSPSERLPRKSHKGLLIFLILGIMTLIVLIFIFLWKPELIDKVSSLWS